MLDVLIPHSRDRLLFSLLGLLNEIGGGIRVLIRTEGEPAPVDSINRIIIDVASRQFPVEVEHALFSDGVWHARRTLAERSTADLIMWLDCDVLLRPDWVEVRTRMTPTTIMQQGVKVEAYPSRTYHEDINVLNGEGLRDWNEPFEPYKATGGFCDMALCLWRKRALGVIDWDGIEIKEKGATGEDAMLSALVCSRLETRTVYDPRFVGYHMSPNKFGWGWEVPTDLLMIDRMRKHGVDRDVIDDIYPYLKGGR